MSDFKKFQMALVKRWRRQITRNYTYTTPFNWSVIPLRSKIRILCAVGMCKLCVYTQVNRLCSRPRFLSPDQKQMLISQWVCCYFLFCQKCSGTFIAYNLGLQIKITDRLPCLLETLQQLQPQMFTNGPSVGQWPKLYLVCQGDTNRT